MVFRFKFIKMCFAFFRRIGTKLTCQISPPPFISLKDKVQTWKQRTLASCHLVLQAHLHLPALLPHTAHQPHCISHFHLFVPFPLIFHLGIPVTSFKTQVYVWLTFLKRVTPLVFSKCFVHTYVLPLCTLVFFLEGKGLSPGLWSQYILYNQSTSARSRRCLGVI